VQLFTRVAWDSIQSVMRRLCAKARVVDEAIEQALASIKSPVTADTLHCAKSDVT
jgi:hypothetical protein